MKSRLTIFLSGVSHELGSFRDAVENEIQMKGCFAENQPGFPPDYRTVEEMLRRKLHDADAVIHVVGFRFGAEPNERPAGVPRRSYTQMELDVARELQKPVYVFLSNDASVRDAAQPGEKTEDAEAIALQLAHREAVQKTNYLYYFFSDKAELRRLAAEIPPVQAADFHPEVSSIDKYAPAQLIGREDELKLLNDAWMKVRRAESPRPHVLTFVALGGEGKTSLVAKWAAELAHQGWPGCDAAFAWSFYSQGTREQTAVSSDLFLKEALTFFGDTEMAGSAHGAFDKGRRLAQLVGERRALLILDGLEPLQYAPTSPTPGELKDQGVAALLKGLAAANHGLCVVTTRYSVPDLRAYWQTTAPEEKLLRLSPEAGMALLRSLGVKGNQKEFETLVADVKGHALTLNMLGTFLRDAHGGDIRRRDVVKLEEADAEEQGGHAFRVMDAYVQSFETGGKTEEENKRGRRALAFLRLLGLFDRPATADCLEALWRVPFIPGMTETLVGMSEAQRNIALKQLEDAKMLTVNRDAANRLLTLDSHPLIREYFARRVREQQPEAWRAAHRRLYEHLCATTKDKPDATLEDLQPLYQAVAHGCQAGMQQEARAIYHDRILRGGEAYTKKKLGAFGSDLGAMACFFETPWSRVSPALTERDEAWLLSEAASCLRALGRLTEALEPRRAGLEMGVKQENWEGAAVRASNLSELELTLGDVAGAVGDAEQSVTYADRSGDAFQRMTKRVRLADVLHQAGRRAEAETRFREAEDMQVEREPHFPMLYSIQGFQYCELLLTAVECDAWRHMRKPEGASLKSEHRGEVSESVNACRAVSGRAATALQIVLNGSHNLLDIALNHLTLGRAALYRSLLESDGRRSENAQPSPSPLGLLVEERRGLTSAVTELDAAVAGLRRSGNMDDLPRGFLSRAWCSFAQATQHRLLDLQTQAVDCETSAQRDLDEAWGIAERGPMPLFLADIHLYRARLFHAVTPYPWATGPDGHARGPLDDLADARRLIEKHGYWRRKEELEDAEEASKNWRRA